MRRNPDFVLKYICGVPYLLVTGKDTSVNRKSCSLNETGATFWKLLDKDMPKEKYIEKCIDYFECENDEERKFIEGETRKFVEKMLAAHAFKSGYTTDVERDLNSFVIPEEEYAAEISEKKIGTYKMADLGIEIYGADKALPPNFSMFEEDFKNAKDIQKIVITPYTDRMRKSDYLYKRFECQMSPFMVGEDVCITKARAGYEFLFGKFQHVHWMYMSKSGRYVEIAYKGDDWDKIQYEVYETTRLAFSYFAELHKYVILHSSSLLYNEKAVLFSALSGVGKSTHAALWNRLFGCNIINGDINLIACEEDVVYAYGIPWCGTSEQYSVGKYKLDTIVFLEQNSSNQIKEFDKKEKTIRILNRLISPNWEESQLDMVLDISKSIVEKTNIFGLACNIQDDAAILCKKRVDSEN